MKSHPLPPPNILVADLRADEKPVVIGKTETVVEENVFFRRVRTCFTFTNLNTRTMAGELEFPIPDGAFVCGYALEVNGEMIPGVVCEKEKARVAFENEVKKGIDPGIVEQVKGNIWKTRIFPLIPGTPRKAEVERVEPVEGDGGNVVYEKEDGAVFVGERMPNGAVAMSVREKIAAFKTGIVAWDASGSAKAPAAAWRKKLEALPNEGDWTLLVIRNDVETTAFKDRAALLAAVDALTYDGGTDIGRAVKFCMEHEDMPVLLFTDEIDTLGLDEPTYEEMRTLVIASRDEVRRNVVVRRLAKGETPPADAEVKESGLLATVWAARRMQDLAGQADARRDEFMALGRKYGVAGPGLSLIVLETLDQWLEYKIEPPASVSFHGEWVKRRTAEDDPIAAKRARAEHEERLLVYWEERVKWWNNPKPPRQTPSSGLFDGVRRMFAGRSRDVPIDGATGAGAVADMRREVVMDEPVLMDCQGMAERGCEDGMPDVEPDVMPGAAGSGVAPTVTLKEWDPETPYIDALKAAAKDKVYSVYLKEREQYLNAPAFYLDCAGWFFKAGEAKLAERIITNLAEFKLEDTALWRTMGWRLREAGCYDLAVTVFRKVLRQRGEEAQSRRDLALVLMEQGKALCETDAVRAKAKAALEEAMRLFAEAAFHVCARRSGRRGNDFQVSVIALEELNGLIAWIDAHEWPEGKPKEPEFDPAYRRDLPVKLRIVMSWDADETDIDLHVLEPNGEEAYYGNRRTAEGGFVSEDVTTGYGPEEYLKKELESGEYKILSNYFASHQAALTGATTVTATVYTDWATAREKRQILTLRLEQPQDRYLIGSVKL